MEEDRPGDLMPEVSAQISRCLTAGASVSEAIDVVSSLCDIDRDELRDWLARRHLPGPRTLARNPDYGSGSPLFKESAEPESDTDPEMPDLIPYRPEGMEQRPTASQPSQQPESSVPVKAPPANISPAKATATPDDPVQPKALQPPQQPESSVPVKTPPANIAPVKAAAAPEDPVHRSAPDPALRFKEPPVSRVPPTARKSPPLPKGPPSRANVPSPPDDSAPPSKENIMEEDLCADLPAPSAAGQANPIPAPPARAETSSIVWQSASSSTGTGD